MCNIAPGMPHEVTGLQPTRDSMKNSSGFFRELIRRGSATADEAYYRRYDSAGMDPSSCKGNGPADLIFVTGYFGAQIIDTAAEIAQQEGMDLLILDRAIEEKDGRSIKRLCMAGGEHGYRNLEYEAVQEISEAYREAGAGGGDKDCAYRRDGAGGGDEDCAYRRDGTGGGDEDCAYREAGAGGRDEDCAYRRDGAGRGCADGGSGAGLVIACGDGILYDEMTRDIIADHELIIVGEDMCPSKLWKRACLDEDTWHAFMFFGTEEEKRQAFGEYHARQKELFRQTRAARAR